MVSREFVLIVLDTEVRTSGSIWQDAFMSPFSCSQRRKACWLTLYGVYTHMEMSFNSTFPGLTSFV